MRSRPLGLLSSAALMLAMAALAAARGVSPIDGQAQGDLPPYEPGQEVAGTIRTWGSDEMGALMKRWEEGFAKHHPHIWFEDTLKGSETAQAALYTGVADLALMDREMVPIEWYSLFRRKHYFPVNITVASGSYDVPDKTPALAVFVHKGNPISQLTLKQLDGIFGEQRGGAWDADITYHRERARSAAENIRSWGQVGLTGEWADKPIQVYGYPTTVWGPAIANGASYFFRERVLGGGDMWNPALLEYDRGTSIIAALRQDRYGIAYVGLPYRTADVKTVAVGVGADGAFVAPTPDNVARRTYPLTRSIYISIDRAPSAPLAPRVREFLRYVLSRQGQQDVSRDRGYLPLPAGAVREQLQRLE